MMKKNKIAIIGASGRMGEMAKQAIKGSPNFDLVAEITRKDPLEKLLQTQAEIAIDLTIPEATKKNIAFTTKHGIHAVVGTSGWGKESMQQLQELLKSQPKVGVLIAPNFCIGSLLASKFAATAARYFESVEIIELHHPQKIDAPSATAIRTANMIATARETHKCKPQPDATANPTPGARGTKISGIPVHSLRLSGLLAHQEVLLGSPGEQLTIRHDSFDRKSFSAGMLLAVTEISQHPGLTYGLENFLDLP